MEIKKIHIKTPEEIKAEPLDMVRRRYNSIAEAALNLQKTNEKLREELDLMIKKLINAQEAVDINKKIVMDSLLEQNKTKESFIQEIEALRAKINVNNRKNEIRRVFIFWSN